METEILLNREVEVVSGGSLTLVAFTLNFIVGSGILGLPYAFIESGLILSILLLALSAFISFVTINWVIEISSRAQAYSKVYNQAGIQSEEVFLLENTVSSMHEKEEDKFENFYITRTKFTMNQLCGLFLGKTGQIFFEIALIFFVICTLWVYVAVFGSSLVSVLPFGFTKTHECDVSSDVFEQNCQNAYYCCVAIYAFLMTILCIVDISKLIALQMALTCFTVLCVLLMVSTTLVAMFNTPYQPPSSSSSQIDILSDAYIQSPTLFDFKNLDQIFTIAIFAFVCQHGVPELLHLSGVPNRAAVKRAPFVMCATLALIFLLYNSLSITTVLYFGSEGFPSIITLEWTNYDGKCFGCESSAPGWAVFISYLIAIFPTITVSAAFPLSALTLSSTLDVVTCRLLEDSKYSWIIEKEWENRRRIVIRLIVIWPSFILGMFIKDYSTIIVWPGMFAFFISMIIPALLQIKSLQACTKIYGPEISKSPFYLRILSNPITAWCLIVFAICGLLYTIAMTIYGYTQ
eukprot:TRINITY_DN1036_c0_g1_i7.p1 TRINITY_DN1036_c0_g1~~TRINITY_DN1036_c0_g1_i7.p1  ORF type:complete len:531 (-),score=214.01 TRINITY_DN1036_c0_g1_i7:54-1610(-)